MIVPLIDESLIRSAYALLDREYAGQQRERTPSKIAMPLATNVDGLTVAYTNTMTAQLTCGHFGTKTVYVDEATGEMRGLVSLFSPTGDLLAQYEAATVTAIRCGLMTALATSRFFKGFDTRFLRFGLVGTGRINISNLAVLRAIFGAGIDVRIKGSPRNPEKNLRLFPSTTLARATGALADRDVIVSCTNIFDQDERVGVHDFADGMDCHGSRLHIAHDTGWFLDGSFRDRGDSFADDPVQLASSIDSEFPFDCVKPRFTPADDLNSPQFIGQFESYGDARPAVAYLYGIALADVALAKAIYERDSA